MASQLQIEQLQSTVNRLQSHVNSINAKVNGQISAFQLDLNGVHRTIRHLQSTPRSRRSRSPHANENAELTLRLLTQSSDNRIDALQKQLQASDIMLSETKKSTETQLKELRSGALRADAHVDHLSNCNRDLKGQVETLEGNAPSILERMERLESTQVARTHHTPEMDVNYNKWKAVYRDFMKSADEMFQIGNNHDDENGGIEREEECAIVLERLRIALVDLEMDDEMPLSVKGNQVVNLVKVMSQVNQIYIHNRGGWSWSYGAEYLLPLEENKRLKKKISALTDQIDGLHAQLTQIQKGNRAD